MLLLDELFSALDKNLRAKMQAELREIQRKRGLTTIFVTHDQSEDAQTRQTLQAALHALKVSSASCDVRQA